MIKNKKLLSLLIIIPLIVIVPFVSAILNPPIVVPKGMITFTFDDGWDTTYAYAYPQMQAYGYRGVIGVITDSVGTKPWQPYGYASWSQIQTLVNSGWDAISHSVTHPDFNDLTDSQIIYQLQASQQALNGNLTNNKGSRFWSQPYDDFTSDNYTQEIAQYYNMACLSESTGTQTPSQPLQYNIMRYDINNATTLAQIKSEVDYAQAYQVWLVLIIHIITPSDPSASTYILNSTFASTLAYVKQQNVPVVTFSDVYDTYVAPPSSTPTASPSPAPSPTVTPTPTITPTPTPTNQTVGNMTAEQWADYYQWSTNGSALQTYKGLVGAK